MFLQLGEVVERIGLGQFAGVDQTHEQIAHFGAVQRAIEQRILAMQHRTFQRTFADVVVERRAGFAAETPSALSSDAANK